MTLLRILFVFLLLAHGLIHLMGFVKSFGLAEMAQLTQPISRTTGLLWLATTLLFVVTVGLILLRKDSWWMAALPALLLSQSLIFTHWQDSRAGTVANVIILLVAIVGYGHWQFDRMVRQEVDALLTTPPVSTGVVSADRLASLPPVVQRWLRRSGVVGKPMPAFVHLKQRGQMRLKPGADWIPFEAEQHFSVNRPGFIWQTTIRQSPLLPIVGRDRYVDDRGAMLIKLLALFPVADVRGPETDQGTLLRFLGETSWFPSAALCNYIRWEPVDATSARATMTGGGVSASGLFRFTPEGDMAGFETRRYYTHPEGPTLEDWVIRSTAWKDRDGLRIPCQSEVTWKLKDGDYTWLKLEISDITYEAPAPAEPERALSATVP